MKKYICDACPECTLWDDDYGCQQEEKGGECPTLETPSINQNPVREILFRAWDGKKLSIGKAEYFDDSVNFRFDHFNIDCDKPVLEQYTGLKDKHGNKIFEGDIVAFTAEDELWEPRYNEGTVYFCDGTFWVDCGKDSDDCDVLFSIGHAKLCDESLQIIGNIHDNKMEDIK